MKIFFKKGKGKKGSKNEKRAKGVAFSSNRAKIIILIKTRNDVTRKMLPTLLGKAEGLVNSALVGLRKQGYKIYPIRGQGTPLRIAETETENEKYIAWIRGRRLGSAKQMIKTEFLIGNDLYPKLKDKPQELMLMLNDASNES